jgi:hypothetical protein
MTDSSRSVTVTAGLSLRWQCRVQRTINMVFEVSGPVIHANDKYCFLPMLTLQIDL